MPTTPQRGFTLVELVITVAVIGIMGLIATPALLKFVPNYRVNSAAKVLASEMNLARMRAIAKNNVHHAAFYPASKEIRVYEDPDNDWSTTNTLIKTIDFDTVFPNVTLDFVSVPGVDGATLTKAANFGTTASPVRATFRPNGVLESSGIFYILPTHDKTASRSDRMRAVQLSLAGKATLWRYDAGGSPPWEEYL